MEEKESASCWGQQAACREKPASELGGGSHSPVRTGRSMGAHSPSSVTPASETPSPSFPSSEACQGAPPGQKQDGHQTLLPHREAAAVSNMTLHPLLSLYSLASMHENLFGSSTACLFAYTLTVPVIAVSDTCRKSELGH